VIVLKMPRVVIIFLLITFALSLAIAVAAMRDALPSARLLGVSALVFWVVVYVVFRYFVHNPKKTVDEYVPQANAAPKNRFIERAPVLGKFYIFSGAVVILLGMTATKNRDVFFTVGAVVWGFAGYLLWLGKSKRGA